MAYGYRVILAEDCITDRSEETHNMFIWNMGQKYADRENSKDIMEKISKMDRLEYAFINPRTEKEWY